MKKPANLMPEGGKIVAGRKLKWSWCFTISSLDAWEGLCCLLRERPAVLAHSQTCPYKDPLASAWGVERGLCRVWFKWLQGLCFCLKSDCAVGPWGWGRWCQPVLLTGEGHSRLLSFRRPPQKSEQSPLLWPRLSSESCLQSICAWLWACLRLILQCYISGWQLRFKTSLKSTWWHVDPLPSTERELHRAASGTFLSQKSSCTWTYVLRASVEKATNRLSAICGCLCPLLLNGGSVLPGGFLSSSKSTPWRGTFSSPETQDIPHPTSLSLAPTLVPLSLHPWLCSMKGVPTIL